MFALAEFRKSYCCWPWHS